MKKQRNKLTPADYEKISEAYKTKVEEYSKLTLEQLQELYQTSKGKNRIGGIYKRAMIEVCSKKLQERSIEQGSVVTEMPESQTNPEVNDIARESETDNNIQSESTT